MSPFRSFLTLLRRLIFGPPRVYPAYVATEAVAPAEPAVPESAPGPFYVVADYCISCGYPPAVAPALIKFNKGGEVALSCYFYRQPRTQAEHEAAVEAVEGSCCGALRYCGTDKAIIQTLLASGNAHAVDHPELAADTA